MDIKLQLCQVEDRGSIEKNVNVVSKYIKKADGEFFCIPEFFAHPLGFLRELIKKYGKDAVKEAYKQTNWILEDIMEVSKKYNGYLIAGTIIELYKSRYFNTCYILKNGKILTKYRKINIIDEEIKAGINPGDKTLVFNASFNNSKLKVGIMVCADCLNSIVVDKTCKDAEIVFLPISMTSPDHPKVEGHPVSEKIAKKHEVIVAKTSRTAIYKGKKFGVKSAVISPKGLVCEAKSIDEQILECFISI